MRDKTDYQGNLSGSPERLTTLLQKKLGNQSRPSFYGILKEPSRRVVPLMLVGILFRDDVPGIHDINLEERPAIC
jgi:hypothetical protein